MKTSQKNYQQKIAGLLFFMTLAANACFSQNEKNNWLFGDHCGVSFSPSVNIFSSMSTWEGCASISDGAGQLLFYTDGVTVYNRNGAVMTNGNSLLGSPSSTQSAIIVPKPESLTEYYIFTVDDITGQNGVRYSVVDMDTDPILPDGFISPLDLGKVTNVKNVALPSLWGEKICAVKHSNCKDYWIITTRSNQNNNNFYVYKLTSSGVGPPIPQSVSPSIKPYGYLRGSPTGTKLAMASSLATGNGTVEMYDFSNATGIITHTQTIDPNREFVYGVEFSENEDYLFFSCNDNNPNTLNAKDIFRYDFALPPSVTNPISIHTSQEIIPHISYANLGALQLAPNGKIILIAKGRKQFLDAIDDPDNGGTYLVDHVPLNTISFVGLPTFISGNVRNCDPLKMIGYQPAVPSLFPLAVKNEIVLDGINGKDKEYGDQNGDGTIDILYTKPPNNSLHVLINSAPYGSPPNYPLTGGTSLNVSFCNSFRLFDWNGDGFNDLIVHEGSSPGICIGLYLYDAVNSNYLPPTALMCEPTFAGEQQQLIEVGDLNRDGLPDILISGQGAIQGTQYFENDGLGGFTPNGIIPDIPGSYQCPELYDADCKDGLDLLLSDPIVDINGTLYGARMYFHQNTGATTGFPLTSTGIPNIFGFNDVAQPNTDLFGDWVITRIVDFYNDRCPIAIAYNPDNDQIYYYNQQNCDCDSLVSVSEFDEFESFIEIYPNPATDEISIVSDDNNPIERVSIYSIEGKVITTKEYRNQSMSVKELHHGLYFFVIHTNKGILTRKVVIQ